MAKSKVGLLMEAASSLREEEVIFDKDKAQPNEVIEPVIDTELGNESERNLETEEKKSYIGKKVLLCNICMTPSFSDNVPNEEDWQCPNCYMTGEGFTLVGKVVSNEEPETASVDTMEESLNEEVTKSQLDGLKKLVKISGLSEKEVINTVRPIIGSKIADELLAKINSLKENVKVNTETASVEIDDIGTVKVDVNTKKEIENVVPTSINEPIELEFQEENFNKLVNKFLKENYENVSEFKTKSAKITKQNQLKVEGVINYKSGKALPVTFTTNRFDLKEGRISVRANCPLFGRSDAFLLESNFDKKVFSPQSLRYRFRTQVANESYEVYGKAILENSKEELKKNKIK